jgi:hypothetical protein
MTVFRDALAAAGDVDLLIVDTPAHTEIAKHAHLTVHRERKDAGEAMGRVLA